MKTKNFDVQKSLSLNSETNLTSNDFAIIFKNEKLIDQSLSLSSIVASQNVNQFFEIKPLTAKAKKYNFELKLKDENTSFSTQSLQNFTLSWKVNVLDKTTSQILQTLEINDQVYSQKIKINQVFAPTEIFSNAKNTNFNQYYNPSIWSVGNNTYFARADANDGSNYNIAENNVKQVESWSYDGGKSWSNPQVFLKIDTTFADRKTSISQGVTIFDQEKNKLIFVGNFWAGNLGPNNKGEDLFALDENGLWRAFRVMNRTQTNDGFWFSKNALVLSDDSEFDKGILYFQLYENQWAPITKLSAEQVKTIYVEDKKYQSENIENSTWKKYRNKIEGTSSQSIPIPGWDYGGNRENSAFLQLKYDYESGNFTSKIAFATDLASAKSQFSTQTKQIFDGSRIATSTIYFNGESLITSAGPIVFTFEKDLNLPIGQRRWKLISKYPENYNFADKKADGSLVNVVKDKSQYINLNAGNGVMLKNGTYGIVFNHGGFGAEANNPTLVTGYYDSSKNKVFWQNQGKIRDDNAKKLMFTQIANGSSATTDEFAFLTSFFGKNNDLLFYLSGKVKESGQLENKTISSILVDQEDKNSLGFAIDHRSFYSGFAGFQNHEGDTWFFVVGPSKNQTGTESYNQDGLILLVNSDFSQIYPVDKILGGFQNSVINIESVSKTTKDWTKVKFVVAYETKNDSKTSVMFKKYDLDLNLKKN